MPGVDFEVVRSKISIVQVLEWIGFRPSRQSGNQWRGSCPIPGGRGEGTRYFSVNTGTHRYRCFHCGSFGNQIELWAAVHQVTVYQAAIDLYQRAQIPTPWVTRWQQDLKQRRGTGTSPS